MVLHVDFSVSHWPHVFGEGGKLTDSLLPDWLWTASMLFCFMANNSLPSCFVTLIGHRDWSLVGHIHTIGVVSSFFPQNPLTFSFVQKNNQNNYTNEMKIKLKIKSHSKRSPYPIESVRTEFSLFPTIEMIMKIWKEKMYLSVTCLWLFMYYCWFNFFYFLAELIECDVKWKTRQVEHYCRISRMERTRSASRRRSFRPWVQWRRARRHLATRPFSIGLTRHHQSVRPTTTERRMDRWLRQQQRRRRRLQRPLRPAPVERTTAQVYLLVPW